MLSSSSLEVSSSSLDVLSYSPCFSGCHSLLVVLLCDVFFAVDVGCHLPFVVADSLVSEAPTTSYDAPHITSIEGPGAANASTYGGELVLIHGSNFGPATVPGENATYFERVRDLSSPHLLLPSLL